MGSASHSAPRTTASACLVDGDHFLLIDASPDLRHQWVALQRSFPGAMFDGVVLTHAHMGHYTGLVQFGKEAANTRELPLWVTPSMAAFLRANAPWSALVDLGNLELREVDPGQSFAPWSGTKIRLLPVPHRAEYTDTVAVSLPGAALYLPDIDSWDLWERCMEVVGAHEVAVLDATFWAADEVPGRPVSDIPHPLVPDTLERFEELAKNRHIVLTHLNHTNPLCEPDSPQAATAREVGFEVAEDMRVIGL